MPIFGGFAQDVGNPSPIAEGGSWEYAKIAGDRIGGEEADAVDIGGELAGIIGDDFDRHGSKFLTFMVGGGVVA